MGKIIPTFLEDELKKSYLDYAMSVIISRAIPDVKDGLKPVQRRILFAMHNLGLSSRAGYRKSAKISGEVTANYHPHGTEPVYEALVRMAQPFSLRYPLIDGQGNFGSQDGDPPAAERYTEAKLTKIAEELLVDINKDTVDFVPNYDNSTTEPTVLPARIPNLLINGATGIAVGMATSIPPHNLSEVVDAMLVLLDNPQIDIKGLLELIPGPDFPTGGIIVGKEGIEEYYTTGKGKIILRGRVEIEEDTSSIIITELPYQVNKSALVKHIAELSHKGTLEGIVGIRDESDRHGMRIVIEVNKEPQVIINQLYKHTQLQITYPAIMLALVDNQPKILNMKEALELFLKHRREVIIRRTKYDKFQVEKRLHILEGIRVALENIKEIISMIKEAKDIKIAKDNIVSKFNLSDIQAQAILDMKLSTLTSLEQDRINQEYAQKSSYLKELEEILSSNQKVTQIIKDELKELAENYKEARKTTILEEKEETSLLELIPKEDVVVLITKGNYIKRLPLSTYRTQRQGGVGISTTKLKSEDFTSLISICNTHDTLFLFSNLGRCYSIEAHSIPQESRLHRGKLLCSLLKLREKEEIVGLLPESSLREDIIFVTEKGKAKRMRGDEFKNIRGKQGTSAISLKDDYLVAVLPCLKQDNLFVCTERGKLIRFPAESLRYMGKSASGVRAIRIRRDDKVAGVTKLSSFAQEDKGLLTITEFGYGKASSHLLYRTYRRGGTGILTMKLSEKTGKIVNIFSISFSNVDEELLILTQKGKVLRIPANKLPKLGRATQGIRLIKLKEGDKVINATLLCR